jgi:hypothetical protein
MEPLKIERVLVVGHEKLAVSNPKISCCAWENLVNLPDIADFDVVVIDLVTLPGDGEDVNWSAFSKKFNVNVFLDVVENYGHVVVIGDPKLLIPVSEDRSGETESILAWTGFEFSFENVEGKNIRRSNDSKHKFASSYLQKLQDYKWACTRWAYTRTKHAASRDESSLLAEYTRVRPTETVLAWSRANHAVALRLDLVWEILLSWGRTWREERDTLGSLWLLPEINETAEETVRLILSDFFKMSLGTEEPSWASDMTLPNEEPLRQKLYAVEGLIAMLHSKKAELLAAIEDARKPLKLLYESGKPLEDVVLSVLESLGGQVSRPDDENEEDGWVSIKIGDEERHFVLEVKGANKNQLDERGLGQLSKWVWKGIKERQIRPKGVLIATAACNEPPSHRKPPFSNNFQKTAKLSGVAVLTGIDLLEAYRKHLEGLLDQDLFWQLLWETNGIVNLASAILARGADKEDTRALEQKDDAI